jgi:preprotein translocase subunit YajC
MSSAIVVLALIMYFALSRENKRKDELYGPVDAHVEVDVSEEGDYNRNFRYFT